MRINKKLLLLIFGIFVLLVGGIFLLNSSAGDQRTLTVNSSTTPLTLELNDASYEITESSQDISLEPDIYYYRTSMTVDGNRVILTNKIDLTELKSTELNLDFSIYDSQSISDAICNTYAEPKCPFPPSSLKITYVENYQWAVVLINNSQLGASKAVLNVDPYTGGWIVAGGPDTDPTSGYFPDSVERVLKNE
jgi:hypothetical protein